MNQSAFILSLRFRNARLITALLCEHGLQRAAGPYRWATSGLMHRSEGVLFNDLVGKLLDLQGYIKAENLRDLKIDHNLEFRRILYGQFTRLGTS